MTPMTKAPSPVTIRRNRLAVLSARLEALSREVRNLRDS